MCSGREDENDEEACWFGTWCTWLLVARTTESLQLGRSLVYTSAFWVGIGVLLLSFVLGGLSGAISVGVFFSVTYTAVNTVLRARIRQKYRIQGDWCSDLLAHFCCDNSAAYQEYREAKQADAPKLDFCSGEPLSEIDEKNLSAYGRGGELPLGGTFASHFGSLSKTSRILIGLNLLLALVVLISELSIGSQLNVAVLLLVFLQPLLILYYVYWRKRRSMVSLDAVVKMFTVGFYFATFQSIILELFLQLCVGALLGAITSTSGLLTDSTDTGFVAGGQSIAMPARKALGALVARLSGVADPSRTFSSAWPQHFIHSIMAAAADQSKDPQQEQDDAKRALMKNNIVVVFIGLFLMAFLIAAGVEETMKYFAVKCCRQLHPMSTPHAVLVCLISAALGFATAENIEYVFGAPDGTSSAANVFLTELVVLFTRLLMPIHVICAVLQAAQLSKVVLGLQQMNTFQILLPAIMLHGSFDFLLFVVGAVSFIYERDDVGLLVASILGPILITIAGIVAACLTFGKVVTAHDNAWRLDSSQSNRPSASTPQASVVVVSPMAADAHYV